MLTVGIISLAFGVFFLVIYQTKIKGSSSPELKNAEKLKALQASRLPQTVSEATLLDVRVGAVIHLEDVGLRSDSFDAEITGRHLHKEGSERWLELEADRGGRKVYLTVEQDDELEISVALEELSLSALGLSKTSFESATHFDFEGARFEREAQGRATYFRDHDELRPEPYAYWEYEDDGSGETVSIVRWDDGDIEVSRSVPLRESSVTIYSQSG